MGKSLLQNLIKLARVTLGGKDDKEYPIQQVEYNGKAKSVFVLFPYGVHANLPEDCIVGLFPVDGSEQNKFGIGGLPNERIKNLPKGEVVFFHPLTKSKIHFKNSGDIDIETEQNINVVCNNANVNATTKIDYTAPQIDLNGIVNISGILNANGGASVTGSLQSNGKDVGDTHKHNQGVDSAGDSQQQINGVV